MLNYYVTCSLGLFLFVFFSGWTLFELFEQQLSVKNTPLITDELAPKELTLDSTKTVVMLNNSEIIRIKKGSMNHRFLSYMFEHSNCDVLISSLYTEAKIPHDTYINKLLANTQLPKYIRNNAFKLTSNSIRLTTKLQQ
ncbi:hypothetical protein J7Y46_004505 [Vibrio parahaemolyticus]|nr:hypothetical protein [Vibrio parahaemolyticus]